MTNDRILITGATGNVGRETLYALMQQPDQNPPYVVAGVRDPAKAQAYLDIQPHEFVMLDFADAQTFDLALMGIRRVLLIRPPDLADVDRYFKPFIDAMKRAGVEQVVFLSLQGVENNPLTPHHKIEKLLIEAGLVFTFLRPSFFMQNLSTTHRTEIQQRSELFVPAGKSRTSFVDVRDVAAVAALTLTNQTGEHRNRGYELTGSETLSYADVARVLTAVLDRPITYRNPSVVYFIWRKWQKEHLPLGFTLIMAALYTVAKVGKAARLTDETERLLGRRPITFRQFALDYKSVWLA